MPKIAIILIATLFAFVIVPDSHADLKNLKKHFQKRGSQIKAHIQKRQAQIRSHINEKTGANIPLPPGHPQSRSRNSSRSSSSNSSTRSSSPKPTPTAPAQPSNPQLEPWRPQENVASAPVSRNSGQGGTVSRQEPLDSISSSPPPLMEEPTISSTPTEVTPTRRNAPASKPRGEFDHLPFARAVPGQAGYVTLPAPNDKFGPIDVRGMEPGTPVEIPHPERAGDSIQFRVP